MLIDSHVHLQLPEFDQDRDAVLQRAREVGVRAVVNIGIDLPTSRASLDLAHREPDVFASVGIHPNAGTTVTPEDLAALAALATDARVVAIGEAGLDYYRDRAPADAQLAACGAQLALADRLDLPLVIHCREAHPEMLALLADWTGGLTRAAKHQGRLGVIHCFSGSVSQARQYIDLGFYVSLTGTVTFPKALDAVTVAREVPLDRLLLETDAPFLAPVPHRGRRNEPARVALVAARVALLRGLTTAAVATACAENTIRLFRLPLKVGADAVI